MDTAAAVGSAHTHTCPNLSRIFHGARAPVKSRRDPSVFQLDVSVGGGGDGPVVVDGCRRFTGNKGCVAATAATTTIPRTTTLGNVLQ